MTGYSQDRFLDGAVTLRQPRRGFRAGLDSVILAAAVPAKAGDKVLELGSGCGVVSLCLAARVAGVNVTGIEIDPELVDLANANAALNCVDTQVHFEAGDVLQLPHRFRHEFSHVFCNPPFHAEDRPSCNAARSRSKHDALNLGRWVETGLKRTAPRGTFTLIIRADRLSDAMARISGTTASTVIFPLWPRSREPAKRLIVQFQKGSRAKSQLLPGLVLHRDDGTISQEADAILRGRSAVTLGFRKNAG